MFEIFTDEDAKKWLDITRAFLRDNYKPHTGRDFRTRPGAGKTPFTWDMLRRLSDFGPRGDRPLDIFEGRKKQRLTSISHVCATLVDPRQKEQVVRPHTRECLISAYGKPRGNPRPLALPRGNPLTLPPPKPPFHGVLGPHLSTPPPYLLSGLDLQSIAYAFIPDPKTPTSPAPVWYTLAHG